VSYSGAFALGTGTAFSLLPSEDVGIVVLTDAAPVGAADPARFPSSMPGVGSSAYGEFRMPLSGLPAPRRVGVAPDAVWVATTTHWIAT
jgi:hypothetical protein